MLKTMLKVKLFFTRRNGPDDIIQLFDDETYFEMVRIVYTPGDHLKKSNEFWLTRRDALSYVSRILKSLESDNDPYEYVQVQTAIHPSVMYPVVELERTQTRHLIEDMVMDAVHANVSQVALKRTVRTPVE